jgi:hypothetical protein
MFSRGLYTTANAEMTPQTYTGANRERRTGEKTAKEQTKTASKEETEVKRQRR